MADHTDPQKQSTFAGDMEETRKRMQQNGRAGEYDDGLVEVRKENPGQPAERMYLYSSTLCGLM